MPLENERRKHSTYRGCTIYVWVGLDPPVYSSSCTDFMRHTVGQVKQDISDLKGRWWWSPIGIYTRIQLLSMAFTYRITNAALLAYGVEVGVKRWMWLATMDAKTCIYCASKHLEVYDIKGANPRPPAHPRCRCAAVLLA